MKYTKHYNIMAALPACLLLLSAAIYNTNTNQAFAWPWYGGGGGGVGDGGYGYGYGYHGYHYGYRWGHVGYGCFWCGDSGGSGDQGYQSGQGQDQGQDQAQNQNQGQTANIRVEGSNDYVSVNQGQHQEQTTGSPLDGQCFQNDGWGQCGGGDRGP
jgi:hypothetical protein